MFEGIRLKKEAIAEDRAKVAPLLKLKHEIAVKEFIDEIERLGKKNEIALMRERGTIVNFIQKEKQDIDCIRSMITQTKGGDETYLDRIQQRVQSTEQSMKNFKLKSRQTY